MDRWIEQQLRKETAVGACKSFTIDLTASGFGVCKCGFKKGEHGDSAQSPKKRASVEAGV